MSASRHKKLNAQLEQLFEIHHFKVYELDQNGAHLYLPGNYTNLLLNHIENRGTFLSQIPKFQNDLEGSIF